MRTGSTHCNELRSNDTVAIRSTVTQSSFKLLHNLQRMNEETGTQYNSLLGVNALFGEIFGKKRGRL